MREMEAEAKKEEDTAKWEKEAEERRRRDEEKTMKNREKRAKKKGKQGGKPQAAKEMQVTGSRDDKALAPNGQAGTGMKKALQVPKRADGPDDSQDGGDDASGAVVEEVGVVIHDDG